MNERRGEGVHSNIQQVTVSEKEGGREEGMFYPLWVSTIVYSRSLRKREAEGQATKGGKNIRPRIPEELEEGITMLYYRKIRPPKG